MSLPASASAIAALLGDRLPTAPGLVTPWASLTADYRQRLCFALAPAAQLDESDYILEPRNEAELSVAIALAHDQRWPLLICGNGTKQHWGQPVAGTPLILSTRRLNRILDYAPADLTVTVEAGLTLAALQQQLLHEGQHLPLDPAYPDQATLGGIVATADAGSLRHRYGGVRDLVLGIQFVRADGQLAKAGGRVVKNVAGYDLMKLFTGAYGSLGVLSRITLKVFPRAETLQTVLLTGGLEPLAQAAQALSISALTPIAFDWLSGQLYQDSLGQGSALAQGGAIALRFGSVAASNQEQCEAVQSLGQQLGLGIQRLEHQPEQAFWQGLGRQLDGLEPHSSGAGDLGPEAPEPGLRCKLGLLPQRIPQLLQRLQEQSPTARCRFHQGSGLGVLGDSPGRLFRDRPTIWNPTQLQQLRQHCEQHSGFLTLLAAPPNLKQQLDNWGYKGNALNAMTRLRQQFDPHGILNPGRFLV
ncbi:MAG: FAD-binding oxidoreductase [Synechococcales cyanobacterium RM1_1_8]|nr:FAD-binding oxidoreductase [Synechococcales cyanobacterium RM1_1_8]